MKETNRRAGIRLVGYVMTVGPDQAFPGNAQIFQKARYSICIPIDKTTYCIDRTLDQAVVLVNRAVLPVCVPALVAHPVMGHRPDCLNPFHPFTTPFGAK